MNPGYRATCGTCIHWKGDTFTDLALEHRWGQCGIKLGHRVTFTLHTGWDGGYVDGVETAGDFVCGEHRPRQEREDGGTDRG